jgi:hypothetical protein
MEIQLLISPTRQFSCTPIGFDQVFRSKEQYDNTGASLSWPGCNWSLPVLSTEISTERRGFCDATDITKNATEEPKRLSRNGLQECFQHVYSRCQKCIVA